MLTRLRQILSSNLASLICIGIAILLRIGFMRMFIQLGSDETGQMVMSRNFLLGKGFTINYSLISDLGQTLYLPPLYWPPGYSFFLSPFLFLTNEQFLMSSFLLDCVGALVFFWYLRKILLLAAFPVWLINLFLLFQGFFLPEYIFNSNSPDFIGLAALVAALYLGARVAGQTKFHFLHFFGFLFFISAVFFLRFQYWPVAILLTLAIIFYGRYQKNKQAVSSGIFSLAVLVVYGISYFLYLQFHESKVYVGDSKTGFYPSNLQYLHPFLFSSFVTVKVWIRHISGLFNTTPEQILQIGRWINIIGLIILSFSFWQLVRKGRLTVNNVQPIWLFSGVVAVASILVLVFFSILKDKDVGPPLQNWTFVFTSRYFAFPELLVQIIAWRWLFFNHHRSTFKKVLAFLFVLVMLSEVSRNIYVVAKRYPNLFPSFSQIFPGRAPASDLVLLITQEKSKGREVVVTGFDKFPAFVAAMNDASGLFNPRVLNETFPKSSKPLSLILVINKEQVDYLSGFLKNEGVNFVKESGGFYFYTYYVEPRAK